MKILESSFTETHFGNWRIAELFYYLKRISASGMAVLTILMLFATQSACVASESRNDIMAEIMADCEKIYSISIPLDTNAPNASTDLLRLDQNTRELIGSIGKLDRLYPSAIDSHEIINGKDFTQTVTLTLGVIKKNKVIKEQNDRMQQLIGSFPSIYCEFELLRLQQIKSNPNNSEGYYESKKRMYEITLVNYRNIMKELTTIYSDADKFTFKPPYSNTPFCEIVADINSIITENDRFLADEKANEPDPEVLKKLDIALFPAKCLTREDSYSTPSGLNSMGEIYNKYLSAIESAKKEDPRAIAKRQDEINVIQDKGVPLYLKYKQVHDEQSQKNEIEKQAQIAERQAAERQKYKQRTKAAKQLGFEYYQDGICNTIQLLSQGMLSMSNARKCLIYTDDSDYFKVQSVLDDCVIYIYGYGSDDIIQIAVKKEKGKYYGEGSALPRGKYHILKTETFTTVIGASKDIIVLESIN